MKCPNCGSELRKGLPKQTGGGSCSKQSVGAAQKENFSLEDNSGNSVFPDCPYNHHCEKQENEAGYENRADRNSLGVCPCGWGIEF